MKIKFLLSKIVVSITLLIFILSCKNNAKGTTENTTAKDATAMVEVTPDFQISLAQWSLHKSFFGELKGWEWFGKMLMESPDSLLQGKLHPDDFPKIAAGYGIQSIELVNTFYYSKADDMPYWKSFKQRCSDAGVSVGLIMCDALGDLGNADDNARQAAVENHYKWVDIAKFLGAHSIRVNAAGKGTAAEVARNAIDGLTKLGEYGASKNINIIVENHGGYSSDGKWLANVMTKVNMPNVGTLPDFGNFCMERSADGCTKKYDRYQGMADLMPFAKGVSAKSHVFDKNGNEVNSDFLKMMKIVKASGFKGYIGIEYEGKELSEDEGIKATKALLEKVFKEI